jgi:hypothetical protein
MSPRVQAQMIQKRFRTPRIPFLLSRFNYEGEALTKRISLFDQSFFIFNNGSRISALMKRVFPLKHFLFKFVFPQYHSCFPTSVF